jgi:energy-coupling factor transporter ATP-binding protein EcfA2
VIELRAKKIAYGAREVLRDLALAFQPGERAAVVGASGAGKTTLLRSLCGLARVDSLRVFGREVRRAADAPAAGVALVFQDPDDQLFAATVVEDVAFGPRNQRLDEREAIERADHALAALAIPQLRDRPIGELSFGEKKRVCLAGALAMRPKLLLLDEPTAGLDPLAEEELVALLASLDVTLVIATHAIDLVPELAARVLVLDGGAVALDGPAREVLSRGEELRRARLRAPRDFAWRARCAS